VETKEELLSRTWEAAVIGVAALIGGGAGWGSFFSAVKGALLAALAAFLLVFLWNLVTSPVRLQAGDHATVRQLREELSGRVLTTEPRESVPLTGEQLAEVLANDREQRRNDQWSAEFRRGARQMFEPSRGAAAKASAVTVAHVELKKVTHDDDLVRVYLEVVNQGGAADFEAELEAEGIPEWYPGQHYAAWDNHEERTRKIPSAGRAFLRLAQTNTDPINGGLWWTFEEWGPSPRTGMRTFVDTTRYRDDQYLHDGSSFVAGHKERVMRVTLYAEPPMHPGPLKVAVRFLGSSVELEK